VTVTANLIEPTDFSILGDWIGKQRHSSWNTPYGPIPAIKGLPVEITHEQKKALSAAAANYGCPLLYLDDHPPAAFQAHLTFGPDELAKRYEVLYPTTAVSLITIGCPQASVGELRAAAELLKGERVTADPVAAGDPPPLWIFTSSANKAIAEKTGLAAIIRDSGALLLENTCPEVVPYDQEWVRHVLTNSMKAEHYIKSGLNGIPTSVMTLPDCIALATGELRLDLKPPTPPATPDSPLATPTAPLAAHRGQLATSSFSAKGRGLPSQGDFVIQGEAFVSEAPITFLGFVNRETGVMEETGHPLDGQSMANKIAIFPKGSGSSVAPYVILELIYRGQGPTAIVNTHIDQHSAPACSLEGVPYAFDFDGDIIGQINHGDLIELRRVDQLLTIRVLKRLT
jgi:predicted aconitase with swiveling domain